MKHFIVTTKPISLAEFVRIVNDDHVLISFDEQVEKNINSSRDLLNEYVSSGRIIYGVNTSVGGFANYLVPIEYAEQLQTNLINSVASNVGEYFDDQVVRAAMFARIISLSKGVSAISIENFRILVDMFNKRVFPCIPQKGSLGASGDLGPLAFIALVGIGRWKAKYNNEVMEGKEALRLAGITPMTLSYKEGLALINGTSNMVGLSAVVWDQATKLLQTYEFVSGLSFEALGTKLKPFDPRVHACKRHAGQYESAAKIFEILSSSQLIVQEEDVEEAIMQENSNTIKGLSNQIEDAYSLRCTPQILGPIRDSLKFIEQTIEDELNSSSDNPIIVPSEKEVFHNGHFHGQYISMAMDYLSISLTTLSNLSDRRIDRYMDKSNSNGLPAFLCREDQGLRLGLMGGQFMSTSLTAENRSLCTPLSIQTLTSTGDFQDIVSLGLIAGRRSKEILDNARYIVSFELLCACQAADMRGHEKLSAATRVLHEEVRKKTPYFDHDVPITPYIEQLRDILIDQQVIDKLEQALAR